MSASELVVLACCDLGAIVRGRAIPATRLDAHLRAGVGWVPANHALTPLGPVAEPNPFGSTGDLRLLPDPDTRVRVEPDGASSALGLVLCDIVETDGAPWQCCPRELLRATLAACVRELGAEPLVSFEHEFQLLLDVPHALSFSLEELRRAEPFPELVMATLAQAGLAPERIFAEYAPHQFEIPLAPAGALAAADHAVLFRELVRESARRVGTRATFVPLSNPDEAGNGVHVHISFPGLHDPERPAQLSELGASFASGVLAHARGLAALTAASPISMARLRPHRWSAGAVCLADRNREALLRIPPLVALGGGDAARQMRLEYRGADASANPHVALAAILRAGLQGVRDALPAPPLLDRDPAQLGPEEAERFGVGALPETLAEALQELDADDLLHGWLPPLMYEAYVAVKRSELEATAELDLGGRCERYARVY